MPLFERFLTFWVALCIVAGGPCLPAEQIDSCMAGLIILAAASCTAMVFVRSQLSDGEPHFTLSQVA